MSIVEGIIDYEFRGVKLLEHINLATKDCVVGKLIKMIFKSQETNIDTVASFACHCINKLLVKYNQSGTKEDDSFDVEEKCNKKVNQKNFDPEKGNKG